MTLIEQLTRDEGLRLYPYTDTAGKLTIGIGRNLTDVGLSKAEAEHLLDHDIAVATARLEEAFPWTGGLDDARRGALLNMTFNLGVGGLGEFRKFLAAMQLSDWKTAAAEMLDSLWAKQVGPRAFRLAKQIETGLWQ